MYSEKVYQNGVHVLADFEIDGCITIAKILHVWYDLISASGNPQSTKGSTPLSGPSRCKNGRQALQNQFRSRKLRQATFVLP